MGHSLPYTVQGSGEAGGRLGPAAVTQLPPVGQAHGKSTASNAMCLWKNPSASLKFQDGRWCERRNVYTCMTGPLCCRAERHAAL